MFVSWETNEKWVAKNYDSQTRPKIAFAFTRRRRVFFSDNRASSPLTRCGSGRCILTGRTYNSSSNGNSERVERRNPNNSRNPKVDPPASHPSAKQNDHVLVQQFDGLLETGEFHHGVRDLSHPQWHEALIKSVQPFGLIDFRQRFSQRVGEPGLGLDTHLNIRQKDIQ